MDEVVYESTKVEQMSGMHEFVEVCGSTKDEQTVCESRLLRTICLGGAELAK